MILTGVSQWTLGFKTGAVIRARIGISLFFGFYRAGPSHQSRRNIRDVAARRSLPSSNCLPHRHYGVVGATALWVSGLMRPTGNCLVLMLVCFLPTNIYSAIYRIDFGEHGAGAAYLLDRIPFQLLLIGGSIGQRNRIGFEKKAAGM